MPYSFRHGYAHRDHVICGVPAKAYQEKLMDPVEDLGWAASPMPAWRMARSR